MSLDVDKTFSSHMSQAELDQLLRAHEDFIGGIKGGKRLVLQFMNLSGLNFAGRNLSDSVLTGSAFIQANMAGAVMDRVSLFGADLRFANLEGASLVKADLRGVCARGARLNNADLFQADLREGQVLTHERSGELQALYIDIPAPSGNGQTDFSKATMRRVRLNEAQAGRADFSEAEMHSVRMRNAFLAGANFEGANLEQGDFTGADLTKANLQDSVMINTVLTQAKTEGAQMEGAVRNESVKSIASLQISLDELITSHHLWVETAGKQGQYLDLSGYDLRSAVHLKGTKLTAVKAEKGLFIGMNLVGIELQHAFLDNADFRRAVLVQADFRGASMKGVKLSKADLRRANFQPLVMNAGRTKPVDLTGANLRFADLRGADFKYANLRGADFSFALVEGADFSHAEMDGMITENIDFSLAKNGPVKEVPASAPVAASPDSQETKPE